MSKFIKKIFTSKSKNVNNQSKNESRNSTSYDQACEDVKITSNQASGVKRMHKGSCGFNCCGLECGCCCV